MWNLIKQIGGYRLRKTPQETRTCPDCILHRATNCATRPWPGSSLVAARLALFVVMAALGASFPPVAFPIEQASQPTQWHVKAAGDGQFKNGTKLKVTMGRETILFERADPIRAGRLSTPVARITEVSDSIITGILSDKFFAEGDPDYISGCGREPWASDPYVFTACLAGGMMAESAIAPSYMILSSISYEDHFVRVDWLDEDGEARQITFKVGKKAYRAFLAELRRRLDEHLQGESEGIVAIQESQDQPPALNYPNGTELDQYSQGAVIPASQLGPDSKSDSAHQVWEPRAFKPSGPIGHSRCKVLAADSEEYQENCAPGADAALSLVVGVWPCALLTPPKSPCPLWPRPSFPATARGE